MTRSFPTVSRITEMLRGLTHADPTGHGAAGEQAEVPDWVIAKAGHAHNGADWRSTVPPRAGRLY
jgi:hypothetical protein